MYDQQVAESNPGRGYDVLGRPAGEPVAEFVVDQTAIDAPDFPRDLTWWRRFVPCWVGVRIDPDGTARLTTDTKGRTRALNNWLTSLGRFAGAYQHTALTRKGSL